MARAKRTNVRTAPQLLIAVPKTGFAGGTSGVKEFAADHLEQLGRQLAEAGGRFWSSFSESKVMNPDEIELSLELALEGGSNWLIVSGKTSATVSVAIRWKLGATD